MQSETSQTQPQLTRPRRSGWLASLDRALDRLLAGLTYFVGVMLLFMAGSVVFEVIMRYFLNRPTRWVVEFSEYMLLYMAFLPGAWVLKREGHVRIDLLLNVFSPKVQTMINTVTSGIGVLLCGLFFWFSATLTWETFQSGEILFRAVHVPKWSVLVAIPIGLLLLTFQFGRRVGLYWRGFVTAQPEKEAGPPETPPAFHVG